MKAILLLFAAELIRVIQRLTKKWDGSLARYDMIVRVNSYNPEFIAWQLLCSLVYEVQFGGFKLRAAQPHLNTEDLGNTFFVCLIY